jgi:hypothetical protein
VTDVDRGRLAELRRDIDRIDEEIVVLFGNGSWQRDGSPRKGNGPVYDPAGRQRCWNGAATGQLRDADRRGTCGLLGAIYRVVLSLCRRVQSPLRVAVLGHRFYFSEDAARTALDRR